MDADDGQSVERALSAMLAAHPDAWVGALSATARYVPMPDSMVKQVASQWSSMIKDGSGKALWAAK